VIHTLLAMKNTFVTTQHKAIKDYPAIAAAPVKTSDEFKVTPIHHIKLALIPKQNIGVDPTYQRKLNIKQVNKIKEKWDYDLYEPVCVYMHRDKKAGLTYYQATDGQHRLCAHPDLDVLCRIVNTKAAVTRCIQANDFSTKKGWSVDDHFWAKKVEIDRVGVEDDTFINFTIAAFESKGWNPLHPKKQTPSDIGGRVATIHKYFAKYINNNIRRREDQFLQEESKRLGLNKYGFIPAPKEEVEKSMDEEAHKKLSTIREEQNYLAEQAILDTVNLMQSLYDLTYVAYAGRVWCALFDWLTNKNGLDSSYDYQLIFKTLEEGFFKLPNDRDWREAITPTELHAAANVAISKRLVSDRQHNGLVHVFGKMHEAQLDAQLKTSVC